MGRLLASKGDSPTGDGVHEAEGAAGGKAGGGGGMGLGAGATRGAAGAGRSGRPVTKIAGRAGARGCGIRGGGAWAVACASAPARVGGGRGSRPRGAGGPDAPLDPLSRPGAGRGGRAWGSPVIEPSEDVLDSGGGLRVGDREGESRTLSEAAGRRVAWVSPRGEEVPRRCTSRRARRRTRRGAGEAEAGAPGAPTHGVPQRGQVMRRWKRGKIGYSTRWPHRRQLSRAVRGAPTSVGGGAPGPGSREERERSRAGIGARVSMAAESLRYRREHAKAHS